MRAAAALLVACWAVSIPLACSSNTTPSPVQGDGGVPDGSVQPAPSHWACAGEAGACLSGTAKTKGFKTQPQLLVAELYSLFPLGTGTPDKQETVATDGTWAFDGVAPGAHYYVSIVADFGKTPAVATLAGPLSVPSSGAPVAVTVQPVQAIAAEHGMGGSFVADWASAHVFDPSSGAELTGSDANVSIDVGGTPTAMPWTMTGGQSLYFVDFGTPPATPPAAQSSYTISATAQALGSMPASWKLVPSEPAFMPAITSPASGATVSANGSVAVSWTAQPTADYVTVAAFEVSDGGVMPVSMNPPPTLTSDTTTTKVPLGGPGQYVIDVYFTSAACPTTADGCVLSSAVAATQVTAQ